MKRIPLTQGKVALIDDADYERVSQYKWYAHCPGSIHWYAMTGILKGNGKERTTLALHRFLMNPKPGQCVDHINHNSLDCRRSNMRLCSMAENLRNHSYVPTASHPYKGAYWRKDYGRWFAMIRINGKCTNLGICRTPEEAARRYNKAAKKHYGELAYLNKIPRKSK